MTECAFFDDNNPTDGLPHWATITQVSTFLTVPRSTVRDTVRRASASGEPWVKREEYEDGKAQYLIDTTHEIYKAHEQRWKQNQVTRTEYMTPSSTDWYHVRPSFSSPMYPEESSFPYASAPFARPSWHGCQDNVLRLWPVFRQRLHSWGMQIFQNILAEEEQENPWQWRWGDLHGEGYPSEEEAVIAAIESRLMANEEDHEGQSLSYPPKAARTKPRRLNLFSRRNDSRPF